MMSEYEKETPLLLLVGSGAGGLSCVVGPWGHTFSTHLNGSKWTRGLSRGNMVSTKNVKAYED